MRRKSRLRRVPTAVISLVRRAQREPWILEFSRHALEGMALDNLDVDDVIHAMLHAYNVEREPDERGRASWKYIVCGELEDGFRVYTAGMIARQHDGTETYWFVTVHGADGT